MRSGLYVSKVVKPIQLLVAVRASKIQISSTTLLNVSYFLTLRRFKIKIAVHERHENHEKDLQGGRDLVTTTFAGLAHAARIVHHDNTAHPEDTAPFRRWRRG